MPCQVLNDGSGKFGAYARNLFDDGGGRGLADFGNRAKCLHQFHAAVRADAGDFIQMASPSPISSLQSAVPA